MYNSSRAGLGFSESQTTHGINPNRNRDHVVMALVREKTAKALIFENKINTLSKCLNANSKY